VGFALFYGQREAFEDFLAFDADVQIFDDQLRHKISFNGVIAAKGRL
jgi:hypothetical protein